MGENDIKVKSASFNAVGENKDNKDIKEFVICSETCLAKRQSQYKSPHTVARELQQQTTNGLTEDLSEHYMRLLQEAGQNLSSRDVIISMLQQQLKKLEELYKKNIDETQDIRYKYCSATQELSNLRKICQKIEGDNQRLSHETAEKLQKEKDDDEKEIISLRREAEQWKSQYEELLKRIDTIESGTTALRSLLSDTNNPELKFPLLGMPSGEIMDEHFESVKTSLRSQNDKLDYVITKLENELSSANQRNASLEEQLTIIQIEVHKECVKTKELSEMSIEKLWEENTHLKDELDMLKQSVDAPVEANGSYQVFVDILQNEITRLQEENKKLKDPKVMLHEETDTENSSEVFCTRDYYDHPAIKENEFLKLELDELRNRQDASYERAEELERLNGSLKKELKLKNDYLETLKDQLVVEMEEKKHVIQTLKTENAILTEKLNVTRGENSVQTDQQTDYSAKYVEVKKLYDELVAMDKERGKNCEYEIAKLTSKTQQLENELEEMRSISEKSRESPMEIPDPNKESMQREISIMTRDIKDLQEMKEQYEKDLSVLKVATADLEQNYNTLLSKNQKILQEIACECSSDGDTDKAAACKNEIAQLRIDLAQKEEEVNALKAEMIMECYTSKDQPELGWHQKYQTSLVVIETLQVQLKQIEKENESLRDSLSKADYSIESKTCGFVANFSCKDLKGLVDDLIRENTSLKTSLQNVLLNLEEKVNILIHDKHPMLESSSARKRTIDCSRDSLTLPRNASMIQWEEATEKAFRPGKRASFEPPTDQLDLDALTNPSKVYHTDASDEDSDFDKKADIPRTFDPINEEPSGLADERKLEEVSEKKSNDVSEKKSEEVSEKKSDDVSESKTTEDKLEGNDESDNTKEIIGDGFDEKDFDTSEQIDANLELDEVSFRQVSGQSVGEGTDDLPMKIMVEKAVCSKYMESKGVDATIPVRCIVAKCKKTTTTRDVDCSCSPDPNEDEVVLHVTKYEKTKEDKYITPCQRRSRSVSCCRSPLNLKVEGQVKVSYKNKKGEVNVCTRQVEQNYSLHRTMPMNRIGLDLCVSRSENNVPSIVKLEVNEIDCGVPMPSGSTSLLPSPKALMSCEDCKNMVEQEESSLTSFQKQQMVVAEQIREDIQDLERELCSRHSKMVTAQVTKTIAAQAGVAEVQKSDSPRKIACPARCKCKGKEYKRVRSEPITRINPRNLCDKKEEVMISKEYSTAYFDQIREPEGNL